MHSKKTAQDELRREEARQYWEICRELSQLVQTPADRATDDQIVFLLDELEGVCFATTDRELKVRIKRLLQRYETGGAALPLPGAGQVCQYKLN